MLTSSRMDVEEALQQMKDEVLMQCAQIAYRQGEVHKGCEDCCFAIGDAIRSLMRVQR